MISYVRNKIDMRIEKQKVYYQGQEIDSSQNLHELVNRMLDNFQSICSLSKRKELFKNKMIESASLFSQNEYQILKAHLEHNFSFLARSDFGKWGYDDVPISSSKNWKQS